MSYADRYGDKDQAEKFWAGRNDDKTGNGPEHAQEWHPIDTMPLSTVGTDVDLLDQKRIYSGVTVAGIRYEWDVVAQQHFDGDERVYMGRISDFTITTTRATINVTSSAQWRPHV